MKQLLMTAGPTNVPDAVRAALATEDMYHRDSEVTEVLEQFSERLVGLLNGAGTHSCVTFVASGTGANEAIISAIHGKVLIVNNGRYSARLADVAARYGIPVAMVCCAPLEPVDLDAVELALRSDPAITHILLVHHETATGVLAPLRAMGQLAARYDKLLVVDAISSIGACPFDLQADNVAFASLAPNKCLESYPGISFVLARTSELERLAGRSRSFYFDLYEQWAALRRGSTPYTAAIQTIFAARCALDRWIAEGYVRRCERYAALSARLRTGMEQHGFTPLPIRDDMRSSIVTVFQLPPTITYAFLHDRLMERGIRIYTDPATVKEGRVILATLGGIELEDIDAFLREVGTICEDTAHAER